MFLRCLFSSSSFLRWSKDSKNQILSFTKLTTQIKKLIYKCEIQVSNSESKVSKCEITFLNLEITDSNSSSILSSFEITASIVSHLEVIASYFRTLVSNFGVRVSNFELIISILAVVAPLLCSLLLRRGATCHWHPLLDNTRCYYAPCHCHR